MTKASKRTKAEKAIRDFLASCPPERTQVSIDEFCGGRAPPSYTRYSGGVHDKAIVAAVFSQLQAEGVLGRPQRPPPIPRDNATPRFFPILRRSDP